jgi:aspartate/methionine/tyrosine aminotransferase
MSPLSIGSFSQKADLSLESLLHEVGSLSLDYSDQYGHPLLISALKDFYHQSFSNDQNKNLSQYKSLTSSCATPESLNLDLKILSTAGAAEAIYLTFKSLFKAGDQLCVMKPCYQSLYQVAKNHGCQVHSWLYQPERSFKDNLDQLAAILTTEPDIKALVLNNPNNPLGSAFNSSELAQISKIIGASRLLIVDEVCQPLNTDSKKSALHLHPKTIVFGDLSKAFALPGLRLGWLAARGVDLNQCIAFRNFTSLRTSIISELLAARLLPKARLVVNEHIKLIEHNKSFLVNFLAQQNDFILLAAPTSIVGIATYIALNPLASNYQNLKNALESKAIFTLSDIKVLVASHQALDYSVPGFRLGLGLKPEIFERLVKNMLTLLTYG